MKKLELSYFLMQQQSYLRFYLCKVNESQGMALVRLCNDFYRRKI